MKRRNLFLSFVAIALLLIGVGYAALTDSLQINGTVSTSAANIGLVFSELVSSDANATMTGKNSKTATLSTSALSTIDDTVTFTLTVKATADAGLNVALTGAEVSYLDGETNTNAAGYFSVTYVIAENTVLENNGTYDVVVTVKLMKTPDVASGNQTAKFSFTVNGTAVQAN